MVTNAAYPAKCTFRAVCARGLRARRQPVARFPRVPRVRSRKHRHHAPSESTCQHAAGCSSAYRDQPKTNSTEAQKQADETKAALGELPLKRVVFGSVSKQAVPRDVAPLPQPVFSLIGWVVCTNNPFGKIRHPS